MTSEDVPEVAGEDPAGPSVETIPLKGMRRTIARRMTQAWQVPVFHLSITVNMEPAQARRRLLPGASLTDILIRDCASALREHPALNAHFEDETILQFDDQNIGLAVATERGVVVPVIQRAGGLSDEELIAERRRMVGIGRSGSMKPEDFAGGTFTLSNLGMFGIDQFDAILNVPQVAILAVAATVPHAVFEDGKPVSRDCAQMTLTCDHRAIDGVIGAEFLSTLRALLERQE